MKPWYSVLTACVVLTVVAGCGPGRSPGGQPPMVSVTEPMIESFRAQFNESADRTRVILLLSPT